MASTDTAITKDKEQESGMWEGAKAPFKASYGKLMMWYFLLSDAFTFSGFLIAYGALRFSSPTWPVPDAVFQTAPFGIHTWFPGDKAPLIFVTFMSFLLIISSVTMVRAVQEGHRENQKGVVFWMVLTILGGLGFLGCQAWEWTNLIGEEHMTVTRNPFGTHTTSGVYLNEDGSVSDETFDAGETYLIHKAGGHHGEGEHGGEGGEHAEETHDYSQGDHAGYYVNENNFLQRKYQVTGGEYDGEVRMQSFGPMAFGALFYGITGFHGFHVFSGVLFLIIIAINAGSGIYAARKNGYEMVEKIGLYWHFVDLVWVFVFLVFYLL
ncbi:MAG TPA: cytochrome c oxidase subunit 3 [Saprospiraceae bacterium]|nr:cytochrome c oxidase subunit 3 [Saprospiraceae bacterium]